MSLIVKLRGSDSLRSFHGRSGAVWRIFSGAMSNILREFCLRKNIYHVFSMRLDQIHTLLNCLFAKCCLAVNVVEPMVLPLDGKTK